VKPKPDEKNWAAAGVAHPPFDVIEAQEPGARLGSGVGFLTAVMSRSVLTDRPQ
jgi:hypothetical protein